MLNSLGWWGYVMVEGGRVRPTAAGLAALRAR